jgi:ribosome-associated translation inhibitor RaiA
MQIFINEQKLKISDRLKEKIQTKFDKGLERLLSNYQSDLKNASLSIEKVNRSGYIIKFDMNLPGCSINIQKTSKVLIDGIVLVRNDAKRVIKKSLEKLRGH